MQRLSKKLESLSKYLDNIWSPRQTAMTISMMILFFLLMPSLWYASSWYEDELIQNQRRLQTTHVALHANVLTTAINKRLALLEGLGAFTVARTSDEALRTQFESFAAGLHSGVSGIRNFTIAPRGVQRYVYPLRGNDVTVGHDLINDPRPQVRADVLRSIDTRGTVISGPYELRQGGLGLIARKALYVNNTFWGLVTMAIDLPPVFQEAKLHTTPDDIEIALWDSSGKLFFGNGNVLENNPLEFSVELPDGYWELGAAPRGGWQKVIAKRLLVIQVSGLIIVVLVASILYLIIHHSFTVRKQSKDQIEQLSRFPAENPNPVMRVSNQGVLEYANAAAAPLIIMMGTDADRTVNAEWKERIIKILSNGRPVSDNVNLGERVFNIEFVPILKHGYLNLYCRDITKRKLAEETVANLTRKMNELILFSLAEGIVGLDMQGNHTFINSAAERMLGYEAGELLGRSSHSTWHHAKANGGTYPEADCPILSALQAGAVHHVSNAIFWKKDNSSFPVEYTITPIFEKGKVVGTAVTFTDITERMRIEENLSNKAKRLEMAQAAAKSGIWDWNTVTGQVEWSDQMFALFGLDPQKSSASFEAWESVLHPADVQIAIHGIDEALKERTRLNNDYRIILPDGRIRWINAVGRGEYDAQARPVRMLGVCMDITERKLAEEALKSSENKYRLLADNVSDVIFVLDMSLHYTYVSPSVKALRGYEPEELLTYSPARAMTPSSWELASKSFAEIKTSEESRHGAVDGYRVIELEMLRKDGATVWVEVKFSMLRDENQKAIGILGVTRSIDERRNAATILNDTLDNLRNAYSTIVQVMASAVESRDPYTAGHQVRVTDIAIAIAMELELSNDKIESIRMAGPIHDIGKLSVPAEILAKPTKLTNIEFSLIKEHAQRGYDLLKDVKSPWPLAEIVYQHHERMDGSGYPRNIKGEEICIEARILSVADVVEAMASHRPYRPGLGIDSALSDIEKNRGVFYDNAVADACLRLFREKGFQLLTA